jgi:hypothetical protein
MASFEDEDVSACQGCAPQFDRAFELNAHEDFIDAAGGIECILGWYDGQLVLLSLLTTYELRDATALPLVGRERLVRAIHLSAHHLRTILADPRVPNGSMLSPRTPE